MPIGVLVGLVAGVLACVGTEIYCHRCLAHRAFRMHPALARSFDAFMRVVGGVHPETWASIHRIHHRYADTPLDPHSPLQRHPLLVLVGTPYLFVRARRRLPPESAPGNGRAYAAVRGLVFASSIVAIGPSQTLVALAVHLVCYLGTMGMVNTVGHRSGLKPHPEFPGYDSAWLSVFLLGHGYHNSHHAHPAAARTGLLDPMWPLVRLLSALGLIGLESPRVRRPSCACCVAAVS